MMTRRDAAFAAICVAATLAGWAALAYVLFASLPAVVAVIIVLLVAGDILIALSLANVSGRCSREEEERGRREKRDRETGEEEES